MKISPKALGLTLGIMYGLCLGAMTLFSVYFDWLTPLTALVVGVYPYYEVTLIGALIGAIWGFVDGFIGGLIFGWIYNFFAPGSA